MAFSNGGYCIATIEGIQSENEKPWVDVMPTYNESLSSDLTIVVYRGRTVLVLDLGSLVEYIDIINSPCQVDFCFRIGTNDTLIADIDELKSPLPDVSDKEPIGPQRIHMGDFRQTLSAELLESLDTDLYLEAKSIKPQLSDNVLNFRKIKDSYLVFAGMLETGILSKIKIRIKYWNIRERDKGDELWKYSDTFVL